jgi:hypothetical protein
LLVRRIDHDERISGERARCAVGRQHGLEPRVVVRGLLVIDVEDAVAIEKDVHRFGDANASFGCSPAEPSFESVGIGRMQQQPHFADFFRALPASDGALPAEIPDAHPALAEAADVVRVEGALGTPVEDRIGVAEYSGGSKEMITPARLAGRYLGAPEIIPLALRLRQNEAHLLDLRVAVDDDQKLRAIDRPAACVDRCPGPSDPLLLLLRPVDNPSTIQCGTSSAMALRSCDSSAFTSIAAGA